MMAIEEVKGGCWRREVRLLARLTSGQVRIAVRASCCRDADLCQAPRHGASRLRLHPLPTPLQRQRRAIYSTAPVVILIEPRAILEPWFYRRLCRRDSSAPGGGGTARVSDPFALDAKWTTTAPSVCTRKERQTDEQLKEPVCVVAFSATDRPACTRRQRKSYKTSSTDLCNHHADLLSTHHRDHEAREYYSCPRPAIHCPRISGAETRDRAPSVQPLHATPRLALPALSPACTAVSRSPCCTRWGCGEAALCSLPRNPATHGIVRLGAFTKLILSSYSRPLSFPRTRP